LNKLVSKYGYCTLSLKEIPKYVSNATKVLNYRAKGHFILYWDFAQCTLYEDQTGIA
jgi:hypothetical protein